jgi:hypothetical protein
MYQQAYLYSGFIDETCPKSLAVVSFGESREEELWKKKESLAKSSCSAEPTASLFPDRLRQARHHLTNCKQAREHKSRVCLCVVVADRQYSSTQGVHSRKAHGFTILTIEYTP